MTDSGSDVPGWYGKLAALGDFAQRRLPAGFVRANDAWLAHVMSQSRAQLGAGWLERYLQAPVWRFAWAPGMGGVGTTCTPAPWWFGVLMPSCDKVGRYFPLLVAQARAHAPHGAAALAHLDAWWGHLSHAATQTLTDGASVDAFEAALHAAPRWPQPQRDTATAGPAPLTPLMSLMPLPPLTSLTPLTTLTPLTPLPVPPLDSLGADLLSAQRRAGSLWWCPGDATHAATVRALPGLPQARDFAELLNG